MKFELWSRLMGPATRAFLQEARRVPDFSWWDRLHGYSYARWTYLYIGVATGQHPLARHAGPLLKPLLKLFQTGNGRSASSSSRSSKSARQSLADTYHGKVVPVEAAQKLVTVQQEISLTNLEQIIPYPQARDIILQQPDHIVVLECPCRSSRPNPCLPLDVCLVIGEPFAGLVAEHHPTRSRWITPAEAVEILQAEHERGHVHHAFFKDAMLGRFYAICNCCACCCGAMQAWRNGVPMLAASGYISQIEEIFCIACGDCVDHCPFEALEIMDDRAMVNPDRCMGCGVCVSTCLQEAISLVPYPEKGEPLEIEAFL